MEARLNYLLFCSCCHTIFLFPFSSMSFYSTTIYNVCLSCMSCHKLNAYLSVGVIACCLPASSSSVFGMLVGWLYSKKKSFFFFFILLSCCCTRKNKIGPSSSLNKRKRKKCQRLFFSRGAVPRRTKKFPGLLHLWTEPKILKCLSRFNQSSLKIITIWNKPPRKKKDDKITSSRVERGRNAEGRATWRLQDEKITKL